MSNENSIVKKPAMEESYVVSGWGLTSSIQGYVHSFYKTKPLCNTHYIRCFFSSRFSDMTIITTARKFKVHKVVICGQSKYFSRLFNHNWKVS